MTRSAGSWIIVSRESGLPVFETFSAKTADHINRQRYEVLTALEWLQRFNKIVAKAEARP